MRVVVSGHPVGPWVLHNLAGADLFSRGVEITAREPVGVLAELESLVWASACSGATFAVVDACAGPFEGVGVMLMVVGWFGGGLA